MLQARYVKYPLNFVRPSGTSRGVLTTKTTFFLEVWNNDNPSCKGLGEVSIIEGLSWDNPNQIEDKLRNLCENMSSPPEEIGHRLIDFPAIQMAYEMALLDLKNGGKRIWFNSPFAKGTQPITINGLIWMGDAAYMTDQIDKKISEGFKCLKLKIGAINFEEECDVIHQIRKQFDEDTLEIRVDANGAFAPETALEKLQRLADMDLHSIEQPIKQGQWEAMARLCEETPLPIALDEELIGVRTLEEKTRLIETIVPQYIILKPSLLGGFQATMDWIQAAGVMSTPWWITSALESNVGLAAIAQFTSQFYNPLPQGLGTGQLYTNNITAPLSLSGQKLFQEVDGTWDLTPIKW